MGALENAEAVSFNVNFNNQKPPEKSYAADFATIEYKNDELSFIFAQYDLLGTRLDSAISLKMHGFWARQFLRSIQVLENPSLQEIADLIKISPDALGKIDHNPGHTAKLTGNIIQSVISGYETSMDFYHLSPNALKAAQNKKDAVALVGIVRVEIRTALFLSLIEKLAELESQFPNLPEGMSPPRSRYG